MTALAEIAEPLLPPAFAGWFRHKDWTPHPHQLEMLQAARDGTHALLIAPTGGGKTLAGFLPTLTELAERPREGLHTLYISPLKALAVDIHRNLEQPIAEMRLPIRAETRTGDTPQIKRERQRRHAPQILMTTPESLALLLSYGDADRIFGSLRCVIVDELHALAGTKRGDLLALGLTRLATLAPGARRIGLSATVAHPDALVAWLSPTGHADPALVRTVRGPPGIKPIVEIMETESRLPWAGHMGTYAAKDLYDRIRKAGTTLLFVNTRAQAELVFQALWRLNDEVLPIALHHGSLAAEQRRKVEAAMARGELRAVVATSSLDLGIDWAAVDLVIQIGAPKGASRLLQRIGRSNHRFDAPSVAVLVPANRFEVLECRAASDAIDAMTLDGDPPAPGTLDTLAQHLLGCACSAPFDARAMHAEVRRAAPYAGLTRRDFDDVLDFVAHGGYALRNYDRFHRLKQDAEGRWKVASAVVARQYRMNVGTIVEEEMLKVRLSGGFGKVLGEVEEYFAQGLVPGDTFMFAGQLLRFEGIREMSVICSRAASGEPKVPAYAGGRMPLTTHLADRVRRLLSTPAHWAGLPDDAREWLELQRDRSGLPGPGELMIETFPRGGRYYMVAYCFEGRQAHQTLGMLVTKRMERAGLGPIGFVATDYVLATWSLEPVTDPAPLFDEDMLGDDLEAWMGESSLLRRTFRNVAVIAGLIERRIPGERKTGRQVTVSADLIYDVLRRHQPDHVLLRATRADAARGLVDLGRVTLLLKRARRKLTLRALDRISPLAVPVLLEIGRVSIADGAIDLMLEEAAAEMIAEATPKRGERGRRRA